MAFDPEHLSWPFIFFPGSLIAVLIGLDNRYRGPYFAIADVVFGDIDSGRGLLDREVIGSLLRRIIYLVIAGFLLSLLKFKAFDIASVFFISGFLMIWPAFLKPLPKYTRYSDWEVFCLWVFYAVSCIGFGLFGASVPSIIKAITGQAPFPLIRDNVIASATILVLSLGAQGLIFLLKLPLRGKVAERKEQ